MSLFRKKKKEKLTIEFVEEKSGVKLTYPNQILEGDFDDEKYKELKQFGCSDIWCGRHWIHRDCFSRNCDSCGFYPIVKEYNEKENINSETPTDFVKAGSLPWESIFKNNK